MGYFDKLFGHPKGTNGDDLLSGSSRNDYLEGRKGNDQLFGNDGNDRLTGGKGNDVLQGGKGNDTLYGNSGKDVLLGGAGNDILYGDDKGHGHFSFWWLCKPQGYVDYLDGGSGNDKVYGGSGNDFANYTMLENRGARDYYDGGKGSDTLQLTFTYAEMALTSVQQDISRFELFLDRHGNSRTDNGRVFEFASFDLDVRNFEDLVVKIVNTGPDAINDVGATNENTLRHVSAASGLLKNDIDPDNLDVLTVDLFSGNSAKGAAVVVNADGSYSYDPTVSAALQALAQGATATDSFSYTVRDLAGATDTATVQITVTGVNDAPVAGDDKFTITEDEHIVLLPPGLLANDRDVDGDILVLTSSDPEIGQFGDGGFVFGAESDPALQALHDGETATRLFHYTVDDGHGGTDSATVTVKITGVNDAPEAIDFGSVVAEDEILFLSLTELLSTASAFDVEGDTLTISSFNTAGLVGDAAFVPTGPNAGFTFDPRTTLDLQALGFDEVLEQVATFTISDGHGGFTDVEFHITTVGYNDNPDASSDTGATDEDNVVAGNVLGNDTDVENDSLVVTSNSPSVLGATVNMAADGSYTYDPTSSSELQGLNAGETRTDTFTYSISDGHGGTDTATVEITVAGVNEAQNQSNKVQNSVSDASGLEYFIKFDGVGGSQWLSLGDFTFDLSNPVSGSTGGGAGAGKAIASDLLSALGASATTTDLISSIGSGELLSNVQIEVYRSDDEGKAALLEEFKFSNVTITGLDSSGEAGSSLASDVSFDFTGFGHRFLDFNPATGQQTGSSDMTWDFKAADSGDAALLPDSGEQAIGSQPQDQGSGSLSYFARFEGSSGWLELDSFNMGLDASVATGSGGGGATGKASHTDVSLGLGSSATLLSLGNALVTGKHVGEVEIEVYGADSKGKQMLLDEFRFEHVQITGLDTTKAVDNQLQFTFDQFSHAHADLTKTGTLGPYTQDGWDFQNSVAFTGPAPASDATTPVVSVSDDSSLKYFIKFQDVGGSKWLSLGSFDFDMNNTATGGTGGGAGKAVAGDLNSAMGTSEITTLLSAMIGSGDQPSNVQIEVYRPDGKGKDVLLEEFKFSNVTLTGLDTSGNPGSPLISDVSFDFTGIGHRFISFNPATGQQTVSSTMTWDFQNGNSGNSLFLPDSGAQAIATPPLPQSSGALEYFVRFEGSNGWLELDSFSMGLDASVATGGGGAGKASPTDVSLGLGSSATLLSLGNALVNGQHLGEVEIEVYGTDSKGKQMLFDEFRFEQVQISGLDSTNAVDNKLQFTFDQFSHAHADLTKTGTLGPYTQDGWDFVNGFSFTGPAPAPNAASTTPDTSVSGASGLEYFIKFDGVGGSQWLSLGDFTFDLSNPVSGSTGGGAGAGKAIASDLLSALGASATTTDLISSIGSGELLSNVQIEVYRSDDEGKAALLEEFKFSNVTITGLDSSGEAGSSLASDVSFDFTGFGHRFLDFNPATGQQTGSSDMTWDFKAADSGDAALLPDSGEQAIGSQPQDQGSGSLSYFARFEGSSGWLELDSFNMGLDASVATGSGGGGATGKASHTDVSLGLGSSATLLSLGNALVTGKHVGEVEIEVYGADSKGKQMLLDEFRFEHVQITGLDTTKAVDNQLQFTFDQFSHAHADLTKTGTLGPYTQDGWDFQNSVAFTGPAPHADVDIV